MNAPANESRTAIFTAGENANIGQIHAGAMKKDVERYSNITSRHVLHGGNRTAVDLAVRDLSTILGDSKAVRLCQFRLDKDSEARSANVEATIPGRDSGKTIIISAHLDSTADRDPSYRPPCDPAPGADDDASGIAGVLAAARAIKKLVAEQPSAEPRAAIRFVLFNAEEQAQRGSRAYAKREAPSITAVYQMDMIGYRLGPDTTADKPIVEIHAGYDEDTTTEGESIRIATHLAEVCASAGIPLTPTVYPRDGELDPGQDLSDHTSFHKHHVPAVLVTQDTFTSANHPSAPRPNPDFHLREDVPANLQYEYAAAIARAVTAAAWHRATRMA